MKKSGDFLMVMIILAIFMVFPSLSRGQAPPEPSFLNVPAGDCDGAFTVSWAASSGATYYELQRSPDFFIHPTTIYSGPAISYFESGLAPGEYYYRVWACNATGCSAWTYTPSLASIIIGPPLALSNFFVPSSNNCAATYMVSWFPAKGATSYEVQRATDSSFSDAVTVYTGSGTSYIENGRPAGSYWYRVRASNSCGSTSWTSGGPVVVTSAPSPPASLIVPPSDCDGAYSVSWTSVSGASSYELQRATNSSFADATTIYTGSGMAFNETGRVPGNYYYRVRDSNGCGNSGWAPGGPCLVAVAPLAPSSIIVPPVDFDGSYTVSWAAVNGATSYELQRATNSGFSGATTIYSGSGTSFNEAGIPVGDYWYRVQASNTCGTSGWISASISVNSFPARVASDFDGDGKTDVLWEHTSGTVALWLMNGTSVGSVGIPGAVDSSWQIKGVGDFNGDGKADILWQHTSETVAVWLMNGTAIGSVGIPGAIDSSWQIKGVGDFNGDGKADILWQHTSGTVAVWLMNGTAIGSVGIPGAIDSSWQIKGVGDFNGDGKADVLWQHTSGTVAVWLMNGLAIGSVGVTGSIDSSWQIKGVGDFNGDGKADILWQHTSGTVAVWQMNGMTIGSVGIPGAIDSSWQIKGVGDFNGDGKADILWQHTSGTVAVWLMNGTAIDSVGIPGAVSDLNWKIMNLIPGTVTPPSQNLIGTYSLTGFTVKYSNGTTINEHSSVITSWSGTMKIGSSTITQSVVVNNIPVLVTGTYTITWTNPYTTGIAHITDQTGTHDVSFSISDYNLSTYSGVLNSPTPGITFEEWDYWVKVSDSLSPELMKNYEKEGDQTTKAGVLWIGEVINP